MNAQKGDEFRKYRDIAPEGVDDAAIISLIQRSAGNNAAISAAIENMWHDLPDGKAIGGQVQWNTASKANKKKEVPLIQANDRGGRGGRGRGMPTSGGRGQGATAGRGGAGRGGAPSQGRGPSVVRNPTQQNIIAATAQTTHVAETQPAVVAAVVAPVAAAAPVSVSTSTGTVGWGCGTTLAEKLKQAEIQKLLPPPLPVVQVIVVDHSESLTDGDNSSPEVEYIEVAEEPEEDTVEEVIAVALEEKVEIEAVKEVVELIEKTVELAVQDPVPSVVVEVHEIATPATIQPEPTHVPEVVREREIVQTQELVQESSVPKAFLKMGKWEAPESSAFQFGSFGNFGSSTNEDSIVMSTPAPWGGVAESSDLSQQQGESAGGVWGGSSGVETSASSSSGASTMSALFPQSKGLPSVQSDSSPTGGSSSQNQGRYDQKPSAPPGLDPHPHSGMTKPLPVPRQDSRTVPASQSQARGKHEANQLQQQQYQPQYQQPAAIPPAARGAPIPASMPYGYAPGFDPQYQASYQPAPVMPPPVTGSSPVTAPGAPSAQSQGQVPVAPQGQLQYGPPPGMPNHYANPYYGNPYYGNPYFYGQPQVQNPYYNQARDYQSSRPYGADPYAPGVQYPVYQQGGSFPDASGAYPNMPMQQQQQQQQQQQHPSMGSQSQGVAAAPGTPAAGQSQGQGKQQKGASASSAVPQQQQQQQQLDPNLGYGYNPYNPREAQWQYQQGAQGWGGASMMGFSVGPGGSPPSQGFPQGQSPQQSAAQGQRPSTSYGGPPGHGQGQGQQHQPQQGSFSRGPAPNATGQGPSSGTGQHW